MICHCMAADHLPPLRPAAGGPYGGGGRGRGQGPPREAMTEVEAEALLAGVCGRVGGSQGHWVTRQIRTVPVSLACYPPARLHMRSGQRRPCMALLLHPPTHPPACSSASSPPPPPPPPPPPRVAEREQRRKQQQAQRERDLLVAPKGGELEDLGAPSSTGTWRGAAGRWRAPGLAVVCLCGPGMWATHVGRCPWGVPLSLLKGCM